MGYFQDYGQTMRCEICGMGYASEIRGVGHDEHHAGFLRKQTPIFIADIYPDCPFPIPEGLTMPTGYYNCNELVFKRRKKSTKLICTKGIFISERTEKDDRGYADYKVVFRDTSGVWRKKTISATYRFTRSKIITLVGFGFPGGIKGIDGIAQYITEFIDVNDANIPVKGIEIAKVYPTTENYTVYPLAIIKGDKNSKLRNEAYRISKINGVPFCTFEIRGKYGTYEVDLITIDGSGISEKAGVLLKQLLSDLTRVWYEKGLISKGRTWGYSAGGLIVYHDTCPVGEQDYLHREVCRILASTPYIE